jgi:hypothetical protein
MITGILIFGALMTMMGVGAHSTGLGHFFNILFLPIAKVLIIGIIIGMCLYGCAAGHFPN